jgi:hypothetical protein
MQIFVNAYIIAAQTRAALSHYPSPIRMALSLGEVMRWILNRK